MVSLQRSLLRLHVEAVWGVQLPPMLQDNVELLSESSQPPWRLYAAEMDSDRVAIWRPDVSATEREDLLVRVHEALALPPTMSTDPGISREIALHQIALPTMSIAAAHMLAHPLTSHDQALVEMFEPGSVEYYFHPDRRPLIGVIAEGHLLSLAHSSRRTAEACELGIDTLAEARRKGYALAATVLWAASVAQEELVPLYSAFADNTASLRLAAAAGYRIFARAATIAG
ncbi:MAG: GNAT family N-acetyltransferase [Chloroflexota bacterium]|nr:GNAT family N-acetyltransferase [Chloroflexota bacterium]